MAATSHPLLYVQQGTLFDQEFGVFSSAVIIYGKPPSSCSTDEGDGKSLPVECEPLSLTCSAFEVDDEGAGGECDGIPAGRRVGRVGSLQ